MPLTKKQQEYLLNCSHRWNVKTGATGSGKSFVDYTVVIPKRILATRGEGLLVLLGNTKGTLERNILSPMREIWTPDLVGEISSDNTVKIFGKKVYALGADNKKHVSRIQGATFEYVYGDEITTWAEDVFQMLKSRMRCEHSRFDGTCNPDSPQHWFKRFLDSDADVYQQAYVIDDGMLPANTVAEMKKEYAGTIYYDRFILGKWKLAEGLIYPMFRAETHVKELYPEGGRYFISIDYGTYNPFSAGLWVILRDGTAYREKEYYYSGRASESPKTDEEYYMELEKLAGDRTIERIVIDPSASSFITCIKRHNRFRVRHANNDVLGGIRNVATALNAKRLLFSPDCKDSIREFGLYSWDGKSESDRPIKENDHAMDDIRYFVNTVLRRDLYRS